MQPNARQVVTLTILIVASLSFRVIGNDGCCVRCGCSQECHKVCRLVCEEKKVDIICWGQKCEDFCVPGPSKPGCRHCEIVCKSCTDSSDSAVPHGAPKKFVWTDWIPGYANVYTKSKLMQKIETKKVPSYKWVVEDLCPDCQAKCIDAENMPGDKIPPAVTSVKVK